MIDNQQYVASIMAVFSVIGVLIKLFASNYQGPATAAIYGYGVVAVSLLCIMFINFALAEKAKGLNNNSLSFVPKLFASSMPTLVTLGILWWLITLNLAYYKQINDNDVAKEYSKYSIVSTVLILLQIFVIFKFINTEIAGSKDKKSNPFGPMIYILSIVNAIFIGILTIILKFFSTDG